MHFAALKMSYPVSKIGSCLFLQQLPQALHENLKVSVGFIGLSINFLTSCSFNIKITPFLKWNGVYLC